MTSCCAQCSLALTSHFSLSFTHTLSLLSLFSFLLSSFTFTLSPLLHLLHLLPSFFVQLPFLYLPFSSLILQGPFLSFSHLLSPLTHPSIPFQIHHGTSTPSNNSSCLLIRPLSYISTNRRTYTCSYTTGNSSSNTHLNLPF